MNILLLGSGGREHALAWKIAQSKLCTQLFIAPGNAGTSQHGTNVSMSVNDFRTISDFCMKENIDMLVVGPEDPLVNGIYDFFRKQESLQNIMVIGPSAAAAQLEGSKAFSKHFMQRHNVPTASYAEFTLETFEQGLQHIDAHSIPIVLKADGLAAGKGVVICETTIEAKAVFTSMIKDKQFGEASSRVVIEQFLAGIEVSVFVLTDGNHYKIIGHAKDYKRIGEDDTGPNTGGMGCVTPVPFVTDGFMQKIEHTIIRPTITGIQQEGLEYKGFIFFGLIKVDEEPYVIEYNCRMGDPETEVVMPRLKNDLVALFRSVYEGTLPNQEILYDQRACSTVVAVSGGYPGDYNKGYPITGLETKRNNSMVFHAGTKEQDNQVVTNGGRVLAVTSYGESITSAVQSSLDTLSDIQFEGMYYRKDIGWEFK